MPARLRELPLLAQALDLRGYDLNELGDLLQDSGLGSAPRKGLRYAHSVALLTIAWCIAKYSCVPTLWNSPQRSKVGEDKPKRQAAKPQVSSRPWKIQMSKSSDSKGNPNCVSPVGSTSTTNIYFSLISFYVYSYFT